MTFLPTTTRDGDRVSFNVTYYYQSYFRSVENFRIYHVVLRKIVNITVKVAMRACKKSQVDGVLPSLTLYVVDASSFYWPRRLSPLPNGPDAKQRYKFE